MVIAKAYENNEIRENYFKQKPRNTLFESFSTLCFCSAIVTNLVVSKLPPSSYQHHNLSLRMFKLSKRKTLPLTSSNPFSLGKLRTSSRLYSLTHGFQQKNHNFDVRCRMFVVAGAFTWACRQTNRGLGPSAHHTRTRSTAGRTPVPAIRWAALELALPTCPPTQWTCQ